MQTSSQVSLLFSFVRYFSYVEADLELCGDAQLGLCLPFSRRETANGFRQGDFRRLTRNSFRDSLRLASRAREK